MSFEDRYTPAEKVIVRLLPFALNNYRGFRMNVREVFREAGMTQEQATRVAGLCVYNATNWVDALDRIKLLDFEVPWPWEVAEKILRAITCMRDMNEKACLCEVLARTHPAFVRRFLLSGRNDAVVALAFRDWAIANDEWDPAADAAIEAMCA